MEVDNHIMGFYLHLFVTVIILALACFLRFAYPTFINTREGFRTEMSMKNEDTWIEANRYYGKTVLKFAIIWFFIELGLYFVLNQYPALSVLLSVHILPIVFLVPNGITETHLEKTFDKNGLRKT
jgi:uncharacterized membrane protein